MGVRKMDGISSTGIEHKSESLTPASQAKVEEMSSFG